MHCVYYLLYIASFPSLLSIITSLPLVLKITQPGGLPLGIDTIVRCSKVALVKVMEINAALKAALGEETAE